MRSPSQLRACYVAPAVVVLSKGSDGSSGVLGFGRTEEEALAAAHPSAALRAALLDRVEFLPPKTLLDRWGKTAHFRHRLAQARERWGAIGLMVVADRSGSLDVRFAFDDPVLGTVDRWGDRIAVP